MEILNRKARHDYFIEEEYECGLVLTGTEIKSIRNGSRDNSRVPMHWNKEEYAGFSTVKPWLPVNENKDTISTTVKTGSSSTSTFTGLQNILNGIKKGYETVPYCFRFIGNITDPAVLEGGDVLIDCGSKYKQGITFEGVGNDATFNGFGLRLKNAINVEVRNLGFMNCDSNEGDNIGLQQNNNHIYLWRRI